jgi:hypothetical protein
MNAVCLQNGQMALVTGKGQTETPENHCQILVWKLLEIERKTYLESVEIDSH